MKTMKSSLAGFILFTLFASGSFLTCEIGLGNSVDTKPPTVSVSYPPSFSIIRGDFVVSGKASDETGLSRVLVSLTGKSGADSGATFGPWSATIDKATKAWQVTVPQPAADGDYDVEAVAVDSAGRKTSASISYKIDNTPPVLVVQRPSTKGELADVDLFDAFGADLSFNGNYWDLNGAGTMSVWFYGDDGLPVSSTPYTYVPPTQSWSFKISETTDTSGTWAALKALALVSEDDIGTFWYVIALEDNALSYLDPTEKDAALTAGKAGNRTSHYYNYLDISAELGVGEAYPKFNELSAFDAGDTAALDLHEYDTLVAALPGLRIPSDIALFDAAVNGNFSFEPTSMNPTIEIDSIPISSATPHPTDNTVSPLPNPLIMISRNKDKTDLDMDSIVIELTPFQSDGVTLDTANRETWSGTALTDHAKIKTIGADQVAVNFLIEKSEGEYELAVTVSDKLSHTVTKKFGFRINKGAPSLISVSPDKSTSLAGSVTKINPGAGPFEVVIKGSDDDTDVTLAVTEGGSVPADAVIAPEPPETTGYLTNYTWRVTLDAPFPA